MTHPTVPLPITLLMLAATTVGVGVFMKAHERSQLATEVLTETPAVFAIAKTSTLQYASPEGWPWYERAMADIGSLGDGQVIEFGIVTDPTQDYLAYFATSAFDATAKHTMISIYRYNTMTFAFERLYRGTYTMGEEPHLGKKSFPALHVVGYHDDELLVLLKDNAYQFAPCEDPFLFGYTATSSQGALLALTLNDPGSGLRDYTPDEMLLSDAQIHAAACKSTQ